MTVLSLQALSYANIVKNISFTAHSGEMIGVIGPNGAGKSALLKCLCGVFQPEKGEANADGVSVFTMTGTERARKIAYVAQTQTAGLEMKVAELVALGRLPHGRDPRFPNAEDQEFCRLSLALCELSHYAERNYNHLSGGEKSRVNLARALAVNAPILLADEPLTGLDAKYQIKILKILKAAARSGKIVITVIHDLSLALRFCDRIIAIKNGALFFDETPRVTVEKNIPDQLFETKFHITEHPLYGYSVQIAEEN